MVYYTSMPFSILRLLCYITCNSITKYACFAGTAQPDIKRYNNHRVQYDSSTITQGGHQQQ